MEDQAFDFITTLPPFSSLPESDRNHLVSSMTLEHFSEGTTLTVQGISNLDCIYVIREGSMELYYETNGAKEISGFLKQGEIFGGISILMNGGVSIRTVQMVKDTTCYVLPKKDFLDVCTRHTFFYEFFVERFSRQMMDDSYASMVAAGQALHFLSNLEPFSMLPEMELQIIASKLSIIHYPKDTILFVQGESKVEYLYVIQKGAAERYAEDKDQKILRGILGEGDIYGGISLLVNNGLAVRTLMVTEDSCFYVIPKDLFLNICRQYEAFSEFFTDTFGKRMRDQSYAKLIAYNFQPSEDSPLFLDQTVESLYTPDLFYCNRDLPIQAAASIMSEHNCSSIFIQDHDENFIGVVTDTDFRKKVIAKGYDILKPIADIMSAPLSTIPIDAHISEAQMDMMQKNIKHLAVANNEGNVIGVVTNRDLLKAQGQSPFFVIREIANVHAIGQIFTIFNQMPRSIQNLISSGAKAQNITRYITKVSDSILEKIIHFAIEELGPPPARFAFMIFGSEGRREQTLKTDQDNAIVFENVSKDQSGKVTEYFLKLGDKVCTWLDKAGYAFCKGDIMAKNPKLCKPLSTWKRYFTNWIHTAEPEALLQASIFFDLRHAFGDETLVRELKTHLLDSLSGWPGFFRHMTENALYFRPPIGFFRNFLVASKGEHRDTFDIKAAMQPIVDFARIYALKHKITETNTLERLNLILDKKSIVQQEFNELETAYSYLMQLRFSRQVIAVIEERAAPDNFINPKKLSRIEQSMLKEIFSRVEKFQNKLSFDFTGLT